MRITGVYHVLCTPFQPGGEIDEDSLRRLTDAVITAGVDGLTVLGVMGEAQKLTGPERRRVLEVVSEVNAGRVPVVAGVSANGTRPALEAAREARELGAAAVMVAPPTFLGPGTALTEHFRQIALGADTAIVLQDYPVASGVHLTIESMADLIDAVDAITTVKLESPPTGRRTAALLERTGDRVTVLGGLGAIYLADELAQGAQGTMTGMPYPEALIEIWRLWSSGDRDRAMTRHAEMLPLLVADSQPIIGLAARKHVWVRRGIIESAHLRSPGAELTDAELANLGDTLRVVGVADGR